MSSVMSQFCTLRRVLCRRCDRNTWCRGHNITTLCVSVPIL
jgi:hypothetical protein